MDGEPPDTLSTTPRMDPGSIALIVIVIAAIVFGSLLSRAFRRHPPPV